jgi:hypothetical protein
MESYTHAKRREWDLEREAVRLVKLNRILLGRDRGRAMVVRCRAKQMSSKKSSSTRVGLCRGAGHVFLVSFDVGEVSEEKERGLGKDEPKAARHACTRHGHTKTRGEIR